MKKNIVIILLFFSLAIIAQEDKSQTKETKFFDSFSVESFGSTRHLEFSGLNLILENSGYESSFSSINLSSFFGFRTRFGFLERNLSVGLHVSRHQNDRQNTSFKTDSRLTSLHLEVDYILYRKSDFELSLMSGFLFDYMSLTLSELSNENIDINDAITNFSATNLTNYDMFSNRLGAKAQYYFFKNLGAFLTLGYEFNFSQGDWDSVHSTLLNVPELNSSGVFVNLGINYVF